VNTPAYLLLVFVGIHLSIGSRLANITFEFVAGFFGENVSKAFRHLSQFKINNGTTTGITNRVPISRTRRHDASSLEPHRDSPYHGHVRQIVVPTLKGVLPLWRKLFGLGLQADSSTGERCSLRRHEPSSAGLQAKAFGHHKMALESTLPPHNDGVARRVSERIESCFRAQSEFL